MLFYTLLLTLCAAPLLTALGFDADLLQIFAALSILIAVFDVPRQGWRALLMIIAAIAIGLRVAPASLVGGQLATGALVAGSGIALIATASIVRFAMRADAVDAEHIYAALSAYLLAGVFVGILDWTIETAWPGSFADAGGGPFRLSTAIYYSFVTLATLGYGDVVPRTELARGVAVLEAVSGQLYIAVTIARLVGAYLQSAASGAAPTERATGDDRERSAVAVRPRADTSS